MSPDRFLVGMTDQYHLLRDKLRQLFRPHISRTTVTTNQGLILMKVIELSKQGHVTPHAVRFYVRKGLLHPRRHPYNGYSVFGREDVAQVKLIRTLQALGFTLAEIAKVLEDLRAGHSPVTWMTAVIRARVATIECELIELHRRRDRMATLLGRWGEVDLRRQVTIRSVEDLAGCIDVTNA